MRIRLLHSAIGEKVLRFNDRPCVLGRAGGAADVEMSWDPRVSRRHARIWMVNDEIWFEDLGSRNGSFIEGKKVTGLMRLDFGVEVLVGETVVIVEAQDPEPNHRDTTPPGDPTMSLPQLDEDAVQENTQVTRASVDLTKKAPDPAAAAAALKARSQPRFVTSDQVEVQLDEREELRTLWMRDVSKGGMFLASDSPPPMGRVLHIQLRTPAGSIHLKARVVHVVATSKPGMPAGVGVQFVDLNNEQRATIQAYVDGVSATLSKPNAAPPPPAEAPNLRLGADVKEFLERLEKGDLYAALQVPPEIPQKQLVAKMVELRAAFKRGLDYAPPPVMTRVQRALQVLDRVESKLADPVARLEYDFRAGHIRAEERLAQAGSKSGPSLADLRRVWYMVAPDRVDRAAFLAKKAFEDRHKGAIKDSIIAAEQALEDNPFFEELRQILKTWKKLGQAKR